MYPLPFNPDEAQAVANAMRLKHFGLSWDALDGTTVGPFNTLILCWPYLMGGDVTLSTARLTACILLVVITALMYLTIRQYTGLLQATLFTAPLIIFYGLVTHSDFVHYNSELLSLALLLLANYCVLRMYWFENSNKPSVLCVTLLGLSLGAVPFSKLQAVPIACVIGLSACYLFLFVKTDSKLRTVLLFVATLVVTAILLLVPLGLSGNFIHFFNSYIVWAFIYIHERLSLSSLHQMIDDNYLLLSTLNSEVAIGLVTFAYCILIRRIKIDTKFTIYCIALLAASVYAVVRPGNNFQHYLAFLPPFVVLASVSLAKLPQLKIRQTIEYLVLYCSIVTVFFLPGVFSEAVTNWSSRTSNKIPLKFIWKNPNIFAWLAKPTDRLLIWGYMPEWYLFGGLTPATRETHNYAQISQTKLTGYFRERFLEDLNQSQPEIIIDSVSAINHPFNDRIRHGISAFPELNQYVSGNFIKTSRELHPDQPCPRIYIDKRRASELRSTQVGFKSITESSLYTNIDNSPSVAKLDDGIVTEGTCVDYWIPIKGKLGQLLFVFNKAEPVRKVMILNTRNGTKLDRSTNKLRLTLLHENKTVEIQEISINFYPQWTELIFKAPLLADSIKVEILSYYGLGAGLNEVKVFR